MDFDLPAEDDPRRLEIRAWLASNPRPAARELRDAGYVVPHWPEPWGLDATIEHRHIIEEELRTADIDLPDNPIGIGWAGPTILAGGTDEQRRRFLPPLLSGEEYWCQLFSEPGAGSDLAGLSTRALRDGDEYVINGQKIWTTWAHRADWGILLARTDPAAPKHKGISYFLIDMRSPGIEIRPIVEMTGHAYFNEVFFADVRLPLANRIGSEGEGWAYANITLGNERVSLSAGGVLWGMGPTTNEFIDKVRTEGGIADPVLRQRAADVYVQGRIIDLLGYRIITKIQQGQGAATVAAIKKYIADRHGQELMNLAADLRGPDAMLGIDDEDSDVRDVWHWGFLFSRALTIGGGTTEVLRNIIGERILGLPKEPPPVLHDVTAGGRR